MEIGIKTQSLFFRTAMWWRIGYGFVRLIFGLILLKVVGTPISGIFYSLMSHELTQDPNDVFIQITSPLLQHFPVTVTYFAAIYFIFWGILDVLLSIQLLKHRIWAFPVTIFLIVSFIVYELYRFAHTHSIILLSIIFIDLIVVTLIYREYKNYQIIHLN